MSRHDLEEFEMDSSKVQLHRWAAWLFQTTFDNIQSVEFDSAHRLVGCETCGDYEDTYSVYVYFNDGQPGRGIDYDSVYELIAAVTAEVPS